MSYATTSTETYSGVDIEIVFKSFRQELVMIAQSSGAMTVGDAEAYGYDAELLAKNKYLKSVDVTLLDVSSAEVNAATYTVNTEAGALTTSRVGGVMWPKTTNGSVRIVLSYTASWGALSDDAKSQMRKKLKIGWVPTDADTSHTSLKPTGGRSFVSSAYGVERKDYSK